MIDKSSRCHLEVRGDVTSEGAFTGAMNQTANC
jgi:hypothetical protein